MNYFAGPAHWGGDCNIASKTSQSPIDVETSSAEHKAFADFMFTGYDAVDGALSNNGHTGQ